MTHLRMHCFSIILAGSIIFALVSHSLAGQKKSPIVDDHINPKLKAPITLSAKDASLSEVLKVLSQRSGMNFVSGEGVYREKMTIYLDKTPLDEAINILVRAAGLSYEIIGNSVLIAEPEKLAGEVGQTAYIVELKYVSAPEAARMLSDLTSNIKVDGGGNRLICYTSPRVINEIEHIIKAIDHPHILILLETRLLEVTLDKLDDYGLDWQSLSPVSTSVSHPATLVKEGFKAAKWTSNGLSFRFALDMLVSNGDARVLMDSKLTTTNNREASLHVGDVIPYVIQTYNLSGSGGINQQIQKEETGVKVSVIPHVNEDKQVTLTIKPEVSSIVAFKGAAADIPQTRVRKASTTVRVEDGQTVFIAGLLAQNESDEKRKLPVLGNIPILGALFQNRQKQISKSNLIIEITPRILRTSIEAATGGESISPTEENTQTNE